MSANNNLSLHQTKETMKPNRLDDIFQLQDGIPVIGGMYLGMKEERAKEIVAELEEYKKEHIPGAICICCNC